MSATLYARGLYGRHVYGFNPVGGITPTYPTTHAILFHTTAISLRWAFVSGATSYSIQVSSTPDFSGTLMIDTTSNSGHGHDFTDTGTNNTKRWWRWKSVGSGTHFDTWSEVGSYWVNTSFAESVFCPQNYWQLVNPSPVTDKFMLQTFPMYILKQENLYRIRERNRLGALLSEFITLKGKLSLNFDQNNYMGFQQFREIRRFNEEIKTFFLLTLKDNDENVPTPSCWKVQFETDPDLTMVAHGRQDIMTGSLSLEEV